MSDQMRNWQYDPITGHELERRQSIVAETFDPETGDVNYRRVETVLEGGTTALRWQEVTIDTENSPGFVERLLSFLP